MVCCNEPFHLVKILEIFEYTVFEYCMELVLYGCEHCCALKTVDTDGVKVRFPIELMQVEKSELVEDPAHAGVNLCFIEVLVDGKRVLSVHFLGDCVEPRGASFKSKLLSRD